MFASEKVMREYLSSLLSDEEQQDELEVANKSSINIQNEKLSGKSVDAAVNKTSDQTLIAKPAEQTLRPIKSAIEQLPQYDEPVTNLNLSEPSAVEKLLQQVELKQQQEKTVKEEINSVDLEEVAVESSVVETEKTITEPEQFPDQPFQALFFEVAGLLLAVPLQDLGGIHNLTEINSLIGKPGWFKGVMLNREKKLNVVDSAQWVMPEKYDKSMEQAINYKYLITLGTSDWGLTAERLVETESISPENVKWRNGKGKRPWLYGTIKEKMCALLHVGDLIAMLEQGINARQE